MQIFVKTITGEHITLSVEPTYKIETIKKMIEIKRGIPSDQNRLIVAGNQLEDDKTLKECNIQRDTTMHIILPLNGGGFPSLPSRTFYKVNDNDLISIVVEQKVEGCWNKIPSFIEKSDDQQIKNATQKVQQWVKNKHFQKYENNVVGTVISLFYIRKLYIKKL